MVFQTGRWWGSKINLPENIIMLPCVTQELLLREDEMNGVCKTCGGEEKFIRDFGGDTQRKENA